MGCFIRQRAAPPGMLQKLRQGGGMGGIQEMMKAMMGGSVSDEEMAEMQSAYLLAALAR